MYCIDFIFDVKNLHLPNRVINLVLKLSLKPANDWDHRVNSFFFVSHSESENGPSAKMQIRLKGQTTLQTMKKLT